MTPAEQMKARMRLLMERADKQGAAAAAAAAAENGSGGGVTRGWTRYVLDKHAVLDEDKAAMQALLDDQVGQAGFGGGHADDASLAAGDSGAAFILGTGRAAARRAAARSAADAAHDDAIFGSAASQARQQQQHEQDELEGFDVADLHEGGGGGGVAAIVAVPQRIVLQQQAVSWRERALAKKQQPLL
jgi:hypothetical protein